MKGLIELLHHYGYLIIFVLLLVEGTGMPGIPIWLIFLEAGYLIDKGKMDFSLALMAAIAGNVTGNLIGYYVGAASRGIVYGRTIKMEDTKKKERGGGGRRWSLLTHEDLTMIEGWFSRYGALTVFIGRWFGVIRTPAILAAGFTRMDIRKYASASFLAALTWSFAWQFGAWKAGEFLLEQVRSNPYLARYYVKPEVVIFLALIAMASGYIGWRWMRSHGYE